MATAAAHACRILIAEDDGDDRRLLADAFRQCGLDCTLEFHGDGESLLAALDSADAAPDLVLLDLNMPRMDGRETLQRLRAQERFRRLPVLVMSTSAAEDDISRANRAGCDAYFVKPVEFGALLDLVGLISRRWLSAQDRE
jgi:two-component system response regulator